MIGGYKIIEKGAIMHLIFREQMPKTPWFVWFFLLECFMLLFAPLFFPATQETFDLCVRALMMTITVLLMLIITSFVVTVLRITYIKDLEQREMLKNQYRLSIGDVDSIAASLQNDCLIVQKDGETADEYTARLEQAKQAASKTYWVIGIARFSPFIVMYLHPFADAKVGSRAVLAWESDLSNDQKIVAPDYNFAIETKENYARYIAYFVKGWRDNGAMFKMKMFDGDAETQTKIAQKTVSNND
jgi:hypothetical protein